ncbi:MAG: DNA mismatch repair protein MutS, partial [Alphaproteobacteria bacterium]|nr:DNA mismatch repair protein MutS [Alphaproteobacteria bacterium]
MADVTPLKGRTKGRGPARRIATATPSSASSRAPEKASPPGAARRPAVAAPLIFDRDIDRALSRGRRSPEAKLDLHGMTLAAAERAVARFLEEAVSLDMRV